jgi:uncharacterized membrane protein YkoI
MSSFTRLIAVALVATAATAGAQGAAKGQMAAPEPQKSAAKSSGYKKDLPDSLTREAKVTEATAAATALAKVPKGAIEGVELEREGGKLLYSYDIKVAGKSGIDEVQVDAMTGVTIGKVVHENAAAEKKEEADEAKEKAAGKKVTAKVTAKTKKPPAK